MLIFTLALRNILRNRRRSLLTGLSMFGGYVLIVISFSVQEGTYQHILEAYTRDNSGHLQITHQSYQDKPTLYKVVPQPNDLITRLEHIEFVQAVTPRIQSAAIAYGSEKTAPALLTGIDVVREQQTSYLSDKLTKGQFMAEAPDADGYFQAMIGKGLANQLQLDVGDDLILISQGADGSLANDIFKLSAIVGNKDSEEKLTVYLPLRGIQQFLVMPDQVHQLIVITDDYKNSIQRTAQIKKVLLSEIQASELDVFPWQVVEQEFYRVMEADIEGNVIAQYMVIFLVCIGVLNTILMNILERTGEVGVLKAIGTTPGRIFSQVLAEAFMLSILSCIIGLIVAIPVNWYFANMGLQLPEPMDISGLQMDTMMGYTSLWLFVRPAIIIVLATCAVAFFPAYRAAKIVPLEAMRGL